MPLRAAPATTTRLPMTEKGVVVIAISKVSEREQREHDHAAIGNRQITFDSLQPASSKWWWNGAILKTRLPVSLNDATWMITDSASMTKTPPTNTSRNSCLMRSATVRARRRGPAIRRHPMKMSAGYEFHQRNPRLAPTRAPQKIVSSAAAGSMRTSCR